MLITQVSTILNTVVPEILGETAIVNEDLSNIVDIGIKIGNANAYDQYIGKLVNVIGKVRVTDRVMKGNAPKIFKEAWLYGSIMELLSFTLPEAIDNDAYKLTNGSTYNQDTFYAPDVTVQFFNDKVSWTIPMSFLANGTEDDRITQSFSSPEQCVNFLSGIDLAIENALALQIDALIMRTINNYINTVMYDEIFSTASAGTVEGDYTTTKAVNLIKLYNTKFPSTPVTVATALTNEGFLKYASYIMSLYMDRMTRATSVFNLAGKDRQTPREALHFVTLTDFERASEVFLQSDSYHKDLVELPLHETVAFWQGSGTGFAFDDVSNVHCKIKKVANNGTVTTPEVNSTGIIAVMFDDYACSVTNFKQNATSHYNAKGDFINTFNSVTSGYCNMFDQNFVVFFIADPTPAGEG